MTIVKAEANNLRISPRKLALIAASLRGKRAMEAMSYLQFVPQSAKKPLLKVLKSAISNATHNAKLDEKNLFIKDIQTMEGTSMKRFRARSRGMAHGIIKRTSHLRVILEDEP